MVVVALLSVDLVESVGLVSVVLVVNCTYINIRVAGTRQTSTLKRHLIL